LIDSLEYFFEILLDFSVRWRPAEEESSPWSLASVKHAMASIASKKNTTRFILHVKNRSNLLSKLQVMEAELIQKFVLGWTLETGGSACKAEETLHNSVIAGKQLCMSSSARSHVPWGRNRGDGEEMAAIKGCSPDPWDSCNLTRLPSLLKGKQV
jgi:hypothetical protein